ncbi:MAG TPA: hypothetical protein P5048_02570 [Chlamydiales bacterium]|nr:hypothetical protein [Chlamydiales bacterium]
MKLLKTFLIFSFFPLMILAQEYDVVLQREKILPSVLIGSIQQKKEEKLLSTFLNVLQSDIRLSGLFHEPDLLVVSHEDSSKLKDGWLQDYAVFMKYQDSKFFLDVYESKNRTKLFSLNSDVLKTSSNTRKIAHALFDQMVFRLLNKKTIVNSRILYTVRSKKDEEFISEVWMCDYDGYNAKQLTYEKSYGVNPIFVPNRFGSSHYIFISFKNGQSKLFLGSLDGDKIFPIMPLKGNQLLPSISLSGDKLAFVSDASGRADLFVQHLNKNGVFLGKPQQIFSKPRSIQASSSFAPDGKQIVFVSDKDGSPRLYLMGLGQNRASSRPKVELISLKNRQNGSPSWSYDGRKIAFVAKTEGIYQIWIYDLETKEEWQLTKGLENKENPSFAKDSLHLVYNTEGKEGAKLYLINLMDKKPMLITKEHQECRFPSFEP